MSYSLLFSTESILLHTHVLHLDTEYLQCCRRGHPVQRPRPHVPHGNNCPDSGAEEEEEEEEERPQPDQPQLAATPASQSVSHSATPEDLWSSVTAAEEQEEEEG